MSKKSKDQRVRIVDNIFTTKKSRADIRDRRNVTGDKKNVTDTQNNRILIEVARTVVQEAITAAVRFVKDTKHPIKNIKWITHGEFTAERGRREIQRFVTETWEEKGRWVFYTDFIEREDLIHSFRYIYCVRFSVPTALRPMPRVSAAAHFIVKFTKGKPPDMPVEVFYSFEGQSLVQRPGMMRLREKWPRDLIEAKHVLMESIPF